MTGTTDWNMVLTNRSNVNAVRNFASGNTSGREFYANFANTPSGGVVRNLLRTHGVDLGGRRIIKKLNRRGN
jgi:hypothetical protein